MGRKVKLAENTAVFFDEMTHTYLTRGDYKELLGVTSLMEVMGLSPDYSGIPTETLQKAADRGTAVHKAIETWCKGEPVAIDPDYAEEVIPDLEAFKRLELPVLANEYLVSDNELIASSIDIVLDDLTLVDIKTTSKIHYEAVSWQLSIYKYLFELQNPKKKVKGLKVLHLREGRAEYKDVYERPKEQVLGLLAAYKDNTFFSVDSTEDLAPLSEEAKKTMDLLEELERRIVTLDTQMKEAKALREAQVGSVMAFMKEHHLTNWKVSPTLSFTYVAPTTRQTFDSKRFQMDNPKTYEEYLKTSDVKESLKINLR